MIVRDGEVEDVFLEQGATIPTSTTAEKQALRLIENLEVALRHRGNTSGLTQYAELHLFHHHHHIFKIPHHSAISNV